MELKLKKEKITLKIQKVFNVDDLELYTDWEEKDGKIENFSYYFKPLKKNDKYLKFMDKQKILKDIENYKKICYATHFDLDQYLIKITNIESLYEEIEKNKLKNLFCFRSFNFTLWNYPNLSTPLSIYYKFDDCNGRFKSSRFKIKELYEYLKENKRIKNLKIEEIEYYNQEYPGEQRLCFYFKLDQKDFDFLYRNKKHIYLAVGCCYKDKKYDILKISDFLKYENL